MNCREWEEALALYCGGDLDARRSLEVESHLAGCAGCQIFAGGMRARLEEMRAIHGQEIPAAYFTAVRARVLAKIRPLPWWRRRWLQAALAAVACFILWRELADVRSNRPLPRPVPVAQESARPAAPVATEVVPEPAPKTPPQVAVVHRRPKAARKAVPATGEPLTVRIVTDDPTVVIYWITNPKGE